MRFSKHFITAALVTVCVAPTALAQGKAALAIPTFRNTAGISSQISNGLVDMLSTAFIKANKFKMIERNQLETIMAEQSLGASGAVDPATAARIGKLTGAGYMLIGNVTEAGVSNKRTRGRGFTVDKGSVLLAVDIRFVDSSTGEALWAETFMESRTATTINASYRFDYRTGIGSDIARSVIDQISIKAHTSVYPPKVVNVSGDKVMLNYGEMMFLPCETWDLFSQGESIVDPGTGEVLGSSEEQIGVVQIVKSLPKMTAARLVSGAAAQGAVCRKKSGPPQKKMAKKVNPF
jgi:TolB-like protein